MAMLGKRKRTRTTRPRGQRRLGAWRSTLRLGLVFTVLVGINVYVFFFRAGNVNDLKKELDSTRIQNATGLVQRPASAEAPGTRGDGLDREAGEPNAGRAVEGKVRKGDSLGGLLKREGLATADADQVIRALRPVLDFKSIREGQVYVIRYDDDGKLESFELRATPVVLYRVERGSDDKLVGKRTEAKTETRVFEVSGVVTSSLHEAVKSRGERADLVAIMSDLFAFDLNFYTDTHPGDRFAVVVEKIYLGDEFYRYGRVLAAEYRSREGTFHAFWWQPPGATEGAYYNEKGQNLAKSLLKSPLKYARISSSFNPKRMHPVLHRVKGHWGTDYAAPVGTPVMASAAGKVVTASRQGGAGNLVVIDHGGGLSTYYMHLSRYAKGLKPGQQVKQKQVIAYSGNTGLSTGPHLHFGVKQGVSWVDSQKLKNNRGPSVPGGQLDDFKRAMRPRLAILEKLTAPLTATAKK